MEFNNITSAVYDAWVFVWPPFLMLLISYLCAKLLNPIGTKNAINVFIDKAKNNSVKAKEIHAVLEGYGLAKLIPVTSLVVIISFLYLLNEPVTVAASKLPPHISYIPSVLIEQHSRSNDDSLLLLLRKYPTADSIDTAYSYAQEELYLSKDYTDSKYDRTSLDYKIQNLIKYAAMSLVILFIVNLFYKVSLPSLFARLVVGIFIISAIWSLSVVPLLYDQEQSMYDDWRKIQITLQSEAKELLTGEVTEKESQLLERRGSNERWWMIEFYNSQMLWWAKRNFIEDIR